MDPITLAQQLLYILMINEYYRDAIFMNVSNSYGNKVDSIDKLRNFWKYALNVFGNHIMYSKLNPSAEQHEVSNSLYFLNYFLSYSRAEIERFDVNSVFGKNYETNTISDLKIDRMRAIIVGMLLFYLNKQDQNS